MSNPTLGLLDSFLILAYCCLFPPLVVAWSSANKSLRLSASSAALPPSFTSVVRANMTTANFFDESAELGSEEDDEDFGEGGGEVDGPRRSNGNIDDDSSEEEDDDDEAELRAVGVLAMSARGRQN